MKKYTRESMLLLSFLGYSLVGFTQLWPGDVNNNGVVNGVDVLYVGIAFDSSGPERDDDDDDWEFHNLLGSELWSQSFLDGTNYAYADCDGDGEVEDDDIQNSIAENYLKTHDLPILPDTYSGGIMGTNPQVTLQPQTASVQLGQPIIIDVRLGSTDIPVENFYGIAIEMSYNPDFVIMEEWEFEASENTWYNLADDDAEDVLMEQENTGKMSLAITRTNQQSVSGAGKLGELSIVIQDIFFLQDSDTLNLQIDNIRMIDKDFVTLSVVPDSTFVIITRKETATNHLNVSDTSVKVYPNPIKDIFTILSDDKIEYIELIDITGRAIRMSSAFQQDNKVSVRIREDKKYLPQIALLKVYTKKGLVVKKIVLP